MHGTPKPWFSKFIWFKKNSVCCNVYVTFIICRTCILLIKTFPFRSLAVILLSWLFHKGKSKWIFTWWFQMLPVYFWCSQERKFPCQFPCLLCLLVESFSISFSPAIFASVAALSSFVYKQKAFLGKYSLVSFQDDCRTEWILHRGCKGFQCEMW